MLTLVGKSVPKIDSVDKVPGTARYTVDINFPGMLYGKVLRSRFPHARVLDINTEKAQRLMGVKAVITGKEISSVVGLAVKDQPIFATHEVRYMGDAVAAVAAVDEYTAQAALDLIQVEYEELPGIFDPVEAMNPDAPLVHEQLGTYAHMPGIFPLSGTNICNHFKLRRGDVEKAFSQSDYVFEDTFTTQMVQHCHLEPNAAVAQVDLNGNVTIWSSSQSPYAARQTVADALMIPMNKIRIIVPYVGGGFGGKSGVPKIEPQCAWLAWKVRKRPVKMVLTRKEEFTAASVRHPTVIKVKTGVRKDGLILGREVTIIWDTGAYAHTGPIISKNAGFSAAGPYSIENVRIDSFCVYTNNTIASSFRGFGTPQITWAIESHMDVIADRLGLGPLEMRLRNCAREGTISATGEILHSVGLEQALLKAAEAIGWGKPKKGDNIGRGIACMHKCSTPGTSSAAFVKAEEDGTFSVLTSAVELGQGCHTVIAQLAAEELGISMDEVSVISPDTNATPYDFGTVSSRITFQVGNAVVLACRDLKGQLLAKAGEMLEANPLDLDIKEGRVFVRGAPDKSMGIGEVVRKCCGGKGGPLIGRGSFAIETTPLNPEDGQGSRPAPFWMYAAQATEVKVDRETGVVEVLKVAAAHDVGRAINPLNVETQIEASLAMGLGTALAEELILVRGRTINPSFSEYKIPTALDMPQLMPIIVEEPHRDGPFGAKGMAEPALSATAAAIANAIYDAVGVRINTLPITPEKVLRSLREREKG